MFKTIFIYVWDKWMGQSRAENVLPQQLSDRMLDLYANKFYYSPNGLAARRLIYLYVEQRYGSNAKLTRRNLRRVTQEYGDLLRMEREVRAARKLGTDSELEVVG